jgi:hypothetical protein
VSWPRNDLARSLIALTPASVIQQLGGLTVAAEGEPPLLSVHLASGQVLDGALMRVDSDRGTDVLVLADSQTGRLAYAPLANVAAVELRNPEPFQDVVTGGRLPSPPAGGPVTRLALQREFPSTPEFPLRIDFAALDGSDLLLGNAARLLRALREAVAQVRSDEMGREAWAQVRALRVEHHAGAGLAVVPAPDGLAVRADLSAALPRALSGECFRKISALL